jgi:hypothetical protein
MPSPYESVRRIQQRALDTIRLSLLAELASEQAVASDLASLDSRMSSEASLAASNWQLTAHPYNQRQRADRARLEQDRSGIDVRLGRLRNSMMDACGQMQAIVDAAAGFNDRQKAQEASAEQRQADDFSGTRIAASSRQVFTAGH